ncbi:MAG: IPT/TIG domain-containing protein [Acidobacteriaceae bacterium]
MRIVLCWAFVILAIASQVAVAADRSIYIPYDSKWTGPPDSTWMALDTAHGQIFTAWLGLDRVDILSTKDYHLIHSIQVPSPSALDISPDGSTLAVGTTSAHILFFSTATFAKTNEITVPNAALGVTAFLYTANGNAMIRAAEGLSTGGGITLYWNSSTNAFLGYSNAESPTTSTYQTTGPLARSGDYSKIMLGDASSFGAVQIIDGDTGQILWSTGGTGFGYGGYIEGLAANSNASRYAICVEIPGISLNLVILDSKFNQIYQSQGDCRGLTFSADGKTLYHDINDSSGSETQALDMTTFTGRNVPNYFSGSQNPGLPTFWQAADSTGMVYGMVGDVSGPTIWTALDTTISTTRTPPTASNKVQILHVIDTIGSPQGGDFIRILCSGATPSSSSGSVSVTIGGIPATDVKLYGGLTLPNETYVIAKTPAGMPGMADVVLTVNGSSSTATKAFQYATSRTIIPFSTSPNFLFYDPLRNRLYAAHKDQVEVIDVANKTLLSPLTPVGGKLPNSKFAGLSLSPDGSRLYIADAGANLIHVINLGDPGTGKSIDPGKALGLSSPISPERVFELSNGELIGYGSAINYVSLAGLFVIDPSTNAGHWAQDSFGNNIKAYVWNTTNQGQYALLSSELNGVSSSSVGLWNASSSENPAPNVESQSLVEASANEDGTLIATGGSTPGTQDSYPEILSFKPDTEGYSEGYIEQHFDVSMPIGTPSFFLDPTGALLYKAGSSTLAGTSSTGSTVEIDDMHTYQPAASIVFPEPFITSYSPYADHMLTADPTGRYFFGVTQSGITMMELDSVPLSIGNVQPNFVQPQAGQTLTIRGTGFISGATVTVGGKQVAATYIDPNTLTIDTPALDTGWSDVTVSMPDGSSYTASGLLHVIGAQPTVTITGFSPSSITVSSGIPSFSTSANVTVVGTGFAAYDIVEMDGQVVSSSFLDAQHIQATIPATLTGTAGTIAVKVISPDTGSSNTLNLAMVNPVPVLEDNMPITVVPKGGLNLMLYGTGFVPGSKIQWNGQNLSTMLNGGETASGLESVSAIVTSGLSAQAGTATVTVFNPSPGGGVSNPISVDISAAHPALFLSLATTKTITPFYTFPTTIDLGSQIVGTSGYYGLYLQNIGTASYTLTSASVSSGPISLQADPCTNVPATPTYNTCTVHLIFTPTTDGPLTSTLTITDNTPDSPHIITLTGNAIQTPVPTVTLDRIDNLGDATSASIQGSAQMGGSTIPGTAWLEYGTDPTLTTYTQSPSWNFTGDSRVSGTLTNLMSSTQYAVRIAVQSAGGVGKSPIQLFSTAPATPEIAMSIASGTTSSATVTAGQTASYSLSVSDGGNGYVGTVSFSCAGVPAGSSTATPVTVQISTTAATKAQLHSSAGSFSLALCFLCGFGAFTFRRNLNLRNAALLCCLLFVSLSVVSCGGSNGGSGGGNSAPPSTPTPSGTYYVTLNASSGGVQNSVLLTLTVQ